jgi:catechol 2,3-dioxygenase-like lactoylglutathione lyase family enzyme
MDWTLEVVLLPVSDIDRAVAFYRDQVGFDPGHDTTTDQMHVVQLTPPGSGCSIVIGDLPAHREMAPGSMRGLRDCQCLWSVHRGGWGGVLRRRHSGEL